MSSWIDVPDLAAEIWRLVDQVPPGQVTTYGDIARRLGDVKGAASVAELLLDHQHTSECRCHRVVRAGGAIGLYGDGGSERKAERLQTEGVPVVDEAVPAGLIWATFPPGPGPLERLRDFQNSVPTRLSLAATGIRPPTIGALDVAYPRPGIALGAYALLDADTLELLWSRTIETAVTFPYIPGYLTFRELPVLEALWREVLAEDRAGEVVMIDGNGILHPRRAGIAATFGLLAEVPTIGVTKSRLCGQIVGDLEPLVPSAVMDGDELLGAAIAPATGSAKPIFVSPGNLLGIEDATRITLSTFRDHRVPEPIYHADRLSKGRGA